MGLAPTDLAVYCAPVENSDPAWNDLLQIYPNPLPRGASLHFRKDAPEASEMKIFNLKGQQVHAQKLDGRSGLVSPGLLPGGIYLYRIKTVSGAVQTGKIILMP